MVFWIRRMREKDLDEVLAIERASFPNPWSRTAFEGEIRSRHAYPVVILHRPASRVVGYLCYWIALDECHIMNIAVHPAYRRMGLASRLIDHLFTVCRRKGIHHCFLEVRVSNERAISLYRKYGFEVCAIRKRYYAQTGEDALVMRRKGMRP